MNCLLRAAVHPIKRLIRPLRLRLRLRLIDWQTKQSRAELERLYDMRDDVGELAANEHREQVRLDMRRKAILRGDL